MTRRMDAQKLLSRLHTSPPNRRVGMEIGNQGRSNEADTRTRPLVEFALNLSLSYHHGQEGRNPTHQRQ